MEKNLFRLSQNTKIRKKVFRIALIFSMYYCVCVNGRSLHGQSINQYNKFLACFICKLDSTNGEKNKAQSLKICLGWRVQPFEFGHAVIFAHA